MLIKTIIILVLRLIIVIVIFSLIYYYFIRGEGFANKTEKASFLSNWFTNKGDDISYEDYKNEVAIPHKSNVLEYKDIKHLKRNNLMTVDNIEKVIA